jgi:hypothetical protein
MKELSRICATLISALFTCVAYAQTQVGMTIKFPADIDDHLYCYHDYPYTGKPLQGAVKSITLEEKDQKAVYSFDKAGRLTGLSNYFSGKEMIYKHYNYDKQGHPVKKEYMDNGNKSSAILIPDEFGNPLERRHKESGYKETTIFSYDFAKRQVTARPADADNGQGWTYDFDERGRVTRREKPGKNLSKSVTTYVYNDQDQLVKQTDFIVKDGYYRYEEETTVQTISYDERGFISRKDKETSWRGQDKDKDGNLKPEALKSDKKSFVLYSDYELDAHGNAVINTINHNGNKPETVVRSIVYY